MAEVILTRARNTFPAEATGEIVFTIALEFAISQFKTLCTVEAGSRGARVWS